MLASIGPVAALLVSLGILLLGNGLQNILLPTRAALEGMPTGVIGGVMAVYYVGFVAGCLLVPRLVRRVGHIRCFAVLAAIASAAALAYALAVHPVAWAALRGASGFAFAGLAMVGESWINEKATNENRGSIFSVYRLVDLASSTGGQLMLNLASPADFPLFSVVAMLIALALVPVSLTTAPGPAPIGGVRLQPGRLWRQSPVGVAGVLAVGLANGAVWSLGPVYAVGVGLSDAGVTYFMSAFIVGGALVQWPLGRFSDRHDRRRVVAGSALASAAFGIALALAGGTAPAAALVGVALLGAAALPLYGLAIAHANDRIEASSFLEVAGALLLVFGIGATVGPVVAGVLMQAFGPAMLFAYTAAVHVAAGLFTLYRIGARAPVPAELRETFVPVPGPSPAVFELDPHAAPSDLAATV